MRGSTIDLQVVAWPDAVECLEFGAYFDQDINGVHSPAGFR